MVTLLWRLVDLLDGLFKMFDEVLNKRWGFFTLVVVAVIAGRFSKTLFLLTAAAAGHWTLNDGRQPVDDGDGQQSNWMVDDEGWQSKSEGWEE